MEFKKYQHVERFGKKETMGIEKGTVYIFPKLDGTNGVVWFDGVNVKAGSRNRELGFGKEDNYGFNQYIQANKEKYLAFFNFFPTAVMYGEWLKQHTVKYVSEAYDKFYVFDVVIGEKYLNYESYQPVLSQIGIDYVPLITKLTDYDGTFGEFIDQADYLVDPINQTEGIVIKNYDYLDPYGRVTWGKVLNESFSLAKGQKVQKVVPAYNPEREQQIVDELVTEHFVKKEYAKLIAQLGEGAKGIQGQLLRVVNKTLIDEEGSFIIEKHGENVDFKLINKFTTLKVKQILPELF